MSLCLTIYLCANIGIKKNILIAKTLISACANASFRMRLGIAERLIIKQGFACADSPYEIEIKLFMLKFSHVHSPIIVHPVSISQNSHVSCLLRISCTLMKEILKKPQILPSKIIMECTNSFPKLRTSQYGLDPIQSGSTAKPEPEPLPPFLATTHKR